MKKDAYNILLITGVVTSEHDPKVNGMLRMMLESTGRFKVRITEEFTGATAETLRGYDAVLINYDGKEDLEAPYVGWGEKTERVLYDFVAAGGGAIVYHSSVIKGCPALPEEFVKLVGYEFDFFGGGRKSPKLEFVVNYTDSHEITQGLASSFTTGCDDLFVNLKQVPGANTTVLATVRDALEDYDLGKMQEHLRRDYEGVDFASMEGIGDDVPVAWLNTYGQGRVFAVSVGHGPDTIRRQPFVALVCRAAEWVCAGEVTLPPPDISGINRLRAWPYYLDMTVRQYAALTQF